LRWNLRVWHPIALPWFLVWKLQSENCFLSKCMNNWNHKIIMYIFKWLKFRITVSKNSMLLLLSFTFFYLICFATYQNPCKISSIIVWRPVLGCFLPSQAKRLIFEISLITNLQNFTSCNKMCLIIYSFTSFKRYNRRHWRHCWDAGQYFQIIF